MKARIIGQFHDVYPYMVNGKLKFIVERKTASNASTKVNKAIRKLKTRDWAKVYNYFVEREEIPLPLSLEAAIDKLTI